MNFGVKFYKTKSGFKWAIIEKDQANFRHVVIARSNKARSCKENKENFDKLKKVFKNIR